MDSGFVLVDPELMVMMDKAGLHYDKSNVLPWKGCDGLDSSFKLIGGWMFSGRLRKPVRTRLDSYVDG